MKDKNHICFDLDGVLIDSINLMKFCWEKTAKEFNINYKFDEFSAFIGLPLTSIVSHLGLSNSEKIIEHYKNISFENLEKIKVNQNTIQVLKKYPLIINSQYIHQKQERELKKLLTCF